MSNSLVMPSTLEVLQHAVKLLFVNAELAIPENCPVKEQTIDFLNWSDDSKIKPLNSLFDRIKLKTEKEDKSQYWKPQEISNVKPAIPYPQRQLVIQEDVREYLRETCQEISQILRDRDNWNNESLLALIIEKYGSFIALDDENMAFVDLVRSTAAIAAALTKNTDATHLSLIVGDLSGVQPFIYTISSAGALKSLRARSFYLELVTEEIAQQLLKELELPRTNIIFAGASKLYILATDSDVTKDAVQKVRNRFNQWLQSQFQGKVFLALDSYSFPVEPNKILSQDFAAVWSQANKNLDKQRSQRFKNQLEKLLTPQPAHEPCKVCHRDDVEPDKLKPVNQNDLTSPSACPICCQMFELGEDLFRVDAVVRSSQEDGKRKGSFGSLQMTDAIYHLFRSYENININDNETLFLVNDWNLKHYCYNKAQANLLLLGNYGKTITEQIEENNQTTLVKRSITAEELAQASQGIKRVGYVRMDVDNLGQIFAKGLGENQTLPQIASLSRQMTYFFKVYLNSLAEDRDRNLPQNSNHTKVKISDNKKRDNLLFIYAGGDDLFVSGAWNEVVEFSFDVCQCFRAHTGYNPDITISAGIELAGAKFPLYQAAKRSGDAEEAAKGNGRDSLTLFGETFKWDEWLGSNKLSIETVETKDKEYWQQVTTKQKPPELLGILPIVGRLKSHEMGQDYTRNFVRNLVNISNLQRQKLKEIERRSNPEESKNRKSAVIYEYEDKDIKYYLHLPQIAYTLARLPRNVLDDEDFRKALKNPYNAPYYRAIATWIELLNR